MKSLIYIYLYLYVYFQNTLINYIKCKESLWGQTTKLHFVHRLDYSTSGVICLAKNKKSAGRAGQLFQTRCVNKYYLAVVRGHVANTTYVIQHPVAKDPSNSQWTAQRMMAVTQPGEHHSHSRPALTRLLTLEHGHYDKEPVTIVLLSPYTGRRHQLRVHLSAIGHPVLGDYTYNNDVKPHRMFLHSYRLVLPLEDRTLDIETENPYTNDPQFTSKYSTHCTLCRFITTEERNEACRTLQEVKKKKEEQSM